MLFERYNQAEWLEWSGLPAELNKIRAGGWVVFKKLVEIDCRANEFPGDIEVSLMELGERCGLEAEVAGKIIEALRKKKYLRCYLPDTADEAALIEIKLPVATPLKPAEVARRIRDPHLRDASAYRYAESRAELSTDIQKIQLVIDLYLNHLSQKMNAFILEQIEIVARRFEIEPIREMIERAEKHNMRNIGWVLKELIREQSKKKKDTL